MSPSIKVRRAGQPDEREHVLAPRPARLLRHAHDAQTGDVVLRLRRSLVLLTAAGLVLAAVAFLFFGRDSVDCGSYRFDASAWRAAAAAGPGGETRMREDAKAIARCGVFTGRSNSALRTQLGEPMFKTPDGWSYALAEDPGTDVAWLHFTFDRSRRVVSASVSTI